MANLDTIKAIEDNILAILAAQGFMVEDSSTDPNLDTKALVTLEFGGERFDYTHGEKPKYNDVIYLAIINFTDKAPGTSRDKAVEYAHKLRSNITVNALNVGALAASKYVSKVDHEGYDVDYANSAATIRYRLRVKYREI